MSDILSKSRYVAGLRCPRLLWWLVREPDAPELRPGPALRARFDGGRQVGEAACAAYPGGIFITRRPGRLEEAVDATRAAIQGPAARIYEAAFVHAEVFVAVDLLERGRGGWILREVKSSTHVKEEHLSDATIQTWVLQGAGLPLERIEVVHLDRSCVYPDLSNLFAAEDVTEAVGTRLGSVEAQVGAQQMLLRGSLPDAEFGERCRKPSPCPFLARCWPELPEDHISTLYYGGRRLRGLVRDGVERIRDIPEHVELSGVQDRQRRAVCGNCVVVDAGLDEVLEAFDLPHGYLDFETISPPIPVWDGCRPYDAVPVQFACLTESVSGPPTFFEHLAESGQDPRPALAQALVQACQGAATIFAWNVSFERRCVEHLMEAVPEEAEGLEHVWDRLEDLLPVVREHVYAPDFGGSFSLKKVLPALLPLLAYDDLEVRAGAAASAELERLLLRSEDIPPTQREALRVALLAYCRRDVDGLAELHRWLQAHAG